MVVHLFCKQKVMSSILIVGLLFGWLVRRNSGLSFCLGVVQWVDIKTVVEGIDAMMGRTRGSGRQWIGEERKKRAADSGLEPLTYRCLFVCLQEALS